MRGNNNNTKGSVQSYWENFTIRDAYMKTDDETKLFTELHKCALARKCHC